MPPKDKYTDPKLRDEIKEELKASDKGGAPGQWSARKAQMMAKEYKERGGSYTTDKSQQDQSQQNLEQWGEEEWQTKEGQGRAKKSDGTQKRYLPKKAWEKMTKEEKEETDRKKQKGSKEGKQHVNNTSKARRSRKQANEEEAAESDANAGQECEEAEGASEDDARSDSEENSKNHDKNASSSRLNAARKRKAAQQSDGGPKKQQKSRNGSNAPPGKVGSKHMDAEEPAPRGSADRLPKKGQEVTWKAMPGYVDGKVKEILTKGKTVDGKSVKASRNDPKIVLESNSSGKICVHKPDACFYE